MIRRNPPSWLARSVLGRMCSPLRLPSCLAPRPAWQFGGADTGAEAAVRTTLAEAIAVLPFDPAEAARYLAPIAEDSRPPFSL